MCDASQPRPDERAVLSLVLQRAGLAVTMASDLERAMKSWLERPADLIALASVGNPLENVSRVRAETEVSLVIVIDPITASAREKQAEAWGWQDMPYTGQPR